MLKHMPTIPMLTRREYEDMVKSSKYAIVLFAAFKTDAFSGPAESILLSVIDDLGTQSPGEISFAKVEFEEIGHEHLFNDLGLSGIPSVVSFIDGVPYDRFNFPFNEDEVRSMLLRLLMEAH